MINSELFGCILCPAAATEFQKSAIYQVVSPSLIGDSDDYR